MVVDFIAMKNEKQYVVYNTAHDAFWYNNGIPLNGSAASWTDSIDHAQGERTIADIFNVCCRLYETDMYSLEDMVVIEVTPIKIDGIICDTRVNFENPIWDGGKQKMVEFWAEIEPDLKHITAQKLFKDGLQRMHKVALAWYQRGL